MSNLKDLTISKELLSEVLKLEVVKHSLFNNQNKSFNITYMQSEDSLKSSWMPINIYGFAFRCKEWAYKNSKVNMITVELSKENEDYYEVSVLWGKCFDDYVMHYFKDKNEIVAIIKACEWVLNQEVKND